MKDTVSTKSWLGVLFDLCVAVVKMNDFNLTGYKCSYSLDDDEGGW